jgi:hypothetical protein
MISTVAYLFYAVTYRSVRDAKRGGGFGKTVHSRDRPERGQRMERGKSADNQTDA